MQAHISSAGPNASRPQIPPQRKSGGCRRAVHRSQPSCPVAFGAGPAGARAPAGLVPARTLDHGGSRAPGEPGRDGHGHSAPASERRPELRWSRQRSLWTMWAQRGTGDVSALLLERRAPVRTHGAKLVRLSKGQVRAGVGYGSGPLPLPAGGQEAAPEMAGRRSRAFLSRRTERTHGVACRRGADGGGPARMCGGRR